MIRKAKTTDFDEYMRLETLYNREHNTLENSDFRITSLNKSPLKKNFLKKIKQKNGLFLVLEDGNSLQGYFFGEISRNKMERYGYLHKKILFGYIENVFITKKYRGKKFFKEFTNQFLNYLKKKRIKYCELHVSRNNKIAIKSYEKYGFVSVEQRMRLKLL